jgi:hypothetical protein
MYSCLSLRQLAVVLREEGETATASAGQCIQMCLVWSVGDE